MMLVEEGKVAVSDPVERHLPEFRGLWMNTTKPGEKERRQVRPPRAITLRDLLTHTSGMIASLPEGIGELYTKMHLTLAEAVAIYSQQPLDFEPGTKWQYSNPGIATLGRVVEVASGQPFENFSSERIFQPLGMKDSFSVCTARQGRSHRHGLQACGWEAAALWRRHPGRRPITISERLEILGP
jgi:CubicO group peptidase (beta-lactamase class C family)